MATVAMPKTIARMSLVDTMKRPEELAYQMFKEPLGKRVVHVRSVILVRWRRGYYFFSRFRLRARGNAGINTSRYQFGVWTPVSHAAKGNMAGAGRGPIMRSQPNDSLCSGKSSPRARQNRRKKRHAKNAGP